MNIAYNLFNSVASFTIFFIIFNLAMGFWGRLILKALKIKEKIGYGDILPLIAIFTIINLICRYLSIWTYKMNSLYLFVYIGGVLFAIIEICYFVLKKSQKYTFKIDILKDFIIYHGRLIVAILFCIIFALYFSMMWPDGTMQPMMSTSLDYYSWLFTAEFWKGFSDLSDYGLLSKSFSLDSFGSSIIFGMFSSARFETVVMSATPYGVYLLSLIGVGVYTLVKRVFNFKPYLSFIVSLGVAGCNFFNFLCLGGIFAQLLVTIGYLCGLIVIIENSENTINHENKVKFQFEKKIFFPIMFIFTEYQGGFFVFLSVLLFAKILNDFFSVQNDKLFDLKKVLTIKNNILSFFVVLAVCILLAPQFAIQVFIRTVSAAVQVPGYGLGLLTPLLFVGFPIDYDLWVVNKGPFSYKPYLLFILLLVFLFIVSFFVKKDKQIEQNNFKKISILFVLFLACLCMYLGGFIVLGNKYQVWKFVSCTVVPISFIPLALFIYLLMYAVHYKKAFFIPILIISLIIIISFPLLKFINPRYSDKRHDYFKSLYPMVYAILKVHEEDKDIPRVIFHLAKNERNFAAAAISQTTNKKIGLLQSVYFLPSVQNYYKYMQRGDTIIYSDKYYKGMFLGVPEELPIFFTIFKYSYDDLKQKGAVSYIGMDIVENNPTYKYVRVNILLPERLKNKDSVLNIYFDPLKMDKKLKCQSFEFIPDVEGINLAIKGGLKHFSTIIPKEWQYNGFFNFKMHFPGITPRWPGAVPSSQELSECIYHFKGIEISDITEDELNNKANESNDISEYKLETDKTNL